MIGYQQEHALTTFEAARICHVTHHSIKNWIKRGLIHACRTPGGHFRILEKDLDSFREKFDMLPVDKVTEKKRVMVVDDDPDALAMMETLLSAEDLEITKVSTPTEVGLRVAQLNPSLIVLDFIMPKLDGFQVCAALRANELAAKTPILAITGLTKEEDVQRIFRAGADEYLSKPFTANELASKVHFLLSAQKKPRTPALRYVH